MAARSDGVRAARVRCDTGVLATDMLSTLSGVPSTPAARILFVKMRMSKPSPSPVPSAPSDAKAGPPLLFPPWAVDDAAPEPAVSGKRGPLMVLTGPVPCERPRLVRARVPVPAFAAA
jgi:hypothetical protein